MTRGHFIPRLIERIEVRKDYKDSCIVSGNQLDPGGLKLLVIARFTAGDSRAVTPRAGVSEVSPT
jgi:hypothetical protein